MNVKQIREILKLLKLSNENVPVFRGSGAYLADERTFVESDAARDLACVPAETTGPVALDITGDRIALWAGADLVEVD